jgi:hypothetical protein
MEIISQLSGIVMILGGMILLYRKKIHLERATSNKHMKGDALAAEIGKIISIKAGTPALGLFVMGCLLVMLPIVTGKDLGIQDYKVDGLVMLQDPSGKAIRDTTDLDVCTTYPPVYKVGLGGKLPDVMRVTRGEHGFPTLYFSGADVVPRPIDLNDTSLVTFDQTLHIIRIKAPVVLTSY